MEGSLFPNKFKLGPLMINNFIRSFLVVSQK
jgi:hypothetical protein